jgi:hypothetical protein
LQVVSLLRKVCFAYLGSAWRTDDAQDKFTVLPMGQYREPLPEGFPTRLFRQIHVKDPSGDSNAIDAYDALFGATAMDVEAYELVRVYHALNELLEAVRSQTLPPDLDLLVMGEWAYPTAYAYAGHEASGGSDVDAARLGS